MNIAKKSTKISKVKIRNCKIKSVNMKTDIMKEDVIRESADSSAIQISNNKDQLYIEYAVS